MSRIPAAVLVASSLRRKHFSGGAIMGQKNSHAFGATILDIVFL
jgi:hypothetical protein